MSTPAPLPLEVEAVWVRALRSIASAGVLAAADPESAVSRAYYAAFDAVSALFLLEGQSYGKHTGVEAAVHRDLINTGRWAAELGKTYSDLVALRLTADYGGAAYVTVGQANDAVAMAQRIIDAVRNTVPQPLPLVPPPPLP
jgi:uncharacterized protein (UPF0332 family)